MGGNRSSRPGKRGEQGSSLIYVILSITLLSVFSCGYMAISRYQMKSVLTERTYMEAQITAKTIHSTFCEAVSSGNSQAINSCRLPRYLTKPRQRRSEWDMAGSDGISRVSAVLEENRY